MSKDSVYFASRRLRRALDEAYETIVNEVKARGGLIKTPARSSGGLVATYNEDVYYGDFDYVSSVAIHALRWDEELGLTICTDDMLKNYEYDNDYDFEAYLDFDKDEEELRRFENAVNDPAYFVGFDEYNLDRDKTIISIIEGLTDYLD